MTPTRDKDGLPLHTDECPEYDGKRCRFMGFRPDRFCEPELVEERERALVLAAQVERVKALLVSWSSDRERMEEVATWDGSDHDRDLAQDASAHLDMLDALAEALKDSL
jgi:hypothetical protein